MVRTIVEKRVNESKEKIREMKRLQSRLEKAAETWKSMKDSGVNGHPVFKLVESFVADASDRQPTPPTSANYRPVSLALNFPRFNA